VLPPSRSPSRAERNSEEDVKVGLQMYTVRNSFAKDPMGTLEKVAAAGYKYIEMANHKADRDAGTGFGTPAKELKAKADEVGVSIIGAHFLPTQRTNMVETFYSDAAAVQKIIDYYASIDAKFLSVPIDFFPTLDILLHHCEVYNKVGKACHKAGLKLLYHNHYHEFQRLDGKFMLDLIVNNTDPDYLGIELDAYWTFRGALNPVEKIHEYGKRIAVIHEKDYPLDQVKDLNAWQVLDQDKPVDWDGFHDNIRPDQFIEIGDGIIKIQDVIDAGNEFGVGYILIEQDYTKLDEFASIRRSMANFKKMRGVEL
jgi:sugar phosphate isomerase/epimerase